MTMNRTNIIYILLAFVVLLASCQNPAGHNLLDPRNNEPPAPPATVEMDEATGLIAGMEMEGDILPEDPVITGGDIAWVEGISGNALETDTDGEFLRIPDGEIAEPGLTGTIGVWVYPYEHVAFAGILHKGQETNFSDEAWSLQYWSGYKPSILLYNEAKQRKQLTLDAALTTNEWHYLAVTWDENEVRFYLNGVLAKSASMVGFGPVRNSDGDLLIGSQLPVPYNATYGHLTFRGRIDEVQIYDRALDEQDIVDHWTALAP